MGGTQIKALPIDDVRCPKCPLTPIISIFLNPEGILTCEYRCPFMHFGTMPFDDISLDRERKHGKHCDRCLSKNENEDEDEDNEINVKNAKNFYIVEHVSNLYAQNASLNMMKRKRVTKF